MVKRLVYDKDPTLHMIKDLQNRVAILEGKEPVHEAFCRSCNGTGKTEIFIKHEGLAEYGDVPSNTCRDCGGKCR